MSSSFKNRKQSRPLAAELLSIDAFLILDKPVGISSNQALQRVKRILQAKKAGHTGSLDVLASGLLPICLGEATKFSHYLLNADKFYRVVAKLGERTTTCDAEGEVVETKSTALVTDEALHQALEQFRGESQQIPSMYSALKHEGKPLYMLARQGIEIPRESRMIHIHELNLIERFNDFVTLEVRCSKGTYIRNLIDDIGQTLGCGAYVYSLRRLGAGVFNASQMVSLDMLEESENLEKYLLPIDSALTRFSSIKLTNEQVQKLYYGQVVETEEKAISLIKLINGAGEFFGLGQIQADGSLTSVRLLSRHFTE